MQSFFRAIPKVDTLLENETVQAAAGRWRRSVVVTAIQQTLEQVRHELSQSGHNERSAGALVSAIPEMVAKRLQELTAPSFTSVINATGIVVHTNLGRSPLSEEVAEAIQQYACGYMTLEFDLKTGKRGNRDDGARRLLKLLFPDHEAIVVNNNAAALLLAMNTMAPGKEAVISRGRLIEIGDGFRINQIQEKSGARLREVGTTNRTHADDFYEAIAEHTALLLSVHPSNYRIVGFTAEVELEELVAIGAEHEIPVLEDWGSGCLAEPESLGISNEESADAVLKARPDAICFSGDKLLGGPQAGIIVGKPEAIRRMRSNHLYRALRVDKLTLLALETALRAYLQDREEDIPTIKMLRHRSDELRNRADDIAERIGDERVVVQAVSSRVGGGAAPEIDLPSWGIAIRTQGKTAESVKNALRFNQPPVIARVVDELVLLDMRTVHPAEEDLLVEAVKKMLRG